MQLDPMLKGRSRGEVMENGFYSCTFMMNRRKEEEDSDTDKRREPRLLVGDCEIRGASAARWLSGMEQEKFRRRSRVWC